MVYMASTQNELHIPCSAQSRNMSSSVFFNSFKTTIDDINTKNKLLDLVFHGICSLLTSSFYLNIILFRQASGHHIW